MTRIDGFIILLLTVCHRTVCICPGTGDVHVSMLAEITPSSDCVSAAAPDGFALSQVLAAEYITELVNTGQSSIAVPGINYTIQLNDICDNRTLTIKKATETLPTSLWTDRSVCLGTEAGQENSLPLGFLGSLLSTNTLTLAEYLHRTNIPLVSPSATLAVLSNHSIYDTFFRTALSDNVQSQALVQFALDMNWSYVMLVHTNDIYGIQGAAVVKEYGLKMGLCFSEYLPVETSLGDATHYSDIAEKIIASKAHAVIYFGQEEPARKFIEFYFTLIKDQVTVKNKAILASDGIGKSSDIIGKFSGPIGVTDPEKKLGLITISPSEPNQQGGFRSYVQQRLSGSTTGSALSDAWVNQYKTNCPSCKETDLMKDYTERTMEALVSILQAFKTVHTDLCRNQEGVCSAMGSTPKFYSSMVEVLSTQVTNATAGGVQYTVSYDENGDSIRGEKELAYTLNILEKTGGNVLQFTKVGEYFMDKTYNTQPKLASYTESISNRCTGQCTECLKPHVPYVYRQGESNYVIIGTGGVSGSEDHHTCGEVTAAGFLRMEAFYYGAQELKKLAGIDFSTLYIDTCYAELHTYSILTELFKMKTHALLINTQGQEQTVAIEDFVLVIGDISSGVSLVLQSFLNLQKIPQISYGSTSVWLSDRLRYPLFLRNVPSDVAQAEMMVKLLTEIGQVTAIGLIYTSSVYGKTGSEQIQEQARKNNICISYVGEIDSDESLNGIALNIAKARNSLPRVFVYFGEDRIAKQLINAISIWDDTWSKRGNILIGSEHWGDQIEVIRGNEKIVRGSIVMTLDFSLDWGINERNMFKEFLGTQTPANNTNNPWFSGFWQDHFQCYLSTNFGSPYSTICSSDCSLSDSNRCPTQSQIQYEDVFANHVVMAWYSVAYAIQDFKTSLEVCTNQDCAGLFGANNKATTFFELLRQTAIPRQIGGTIRNLTPFGSNGDGQVNYLVYNIINDPHNIAQLKLIYTIEEGTLRKKSDPEFYHNEGDIDTSFTSKCESENCICYLDTTPKALEIINPTTSKPPQEVTTILLIIILILCILLVIAVIGFTIKKWMNNKETGRRQPIENESSTNGWQLRNISTATNGTPVEAVSDRYQHQPTSSASQLNSAPQRSQSQSPMQGASANQQQPIPLPRQNSSSTGRSYLNMSESSPHRMDNLKSPYPTSGSGIYTSIDSEPNGYLCPQPLTATPRSCAAAPVENETCVDARIVSAISNDYGGSQRDFGSDIQVSNDTTAADNNVTFS